MRSSTWRYLSVVLTALGTVPACGQNIPLAEAPVEGNCFRITTETHVSGSLKVSRDGKQAALKIVGKNEHVFTERVVAEGRGLAKKTARYYQTATSHAVVDGQRSERILTPERRLIVAQRTGDGLFCYSPTGPLTRPDLEIVSEHFETLHLTGLLPGKDVAVGDSWKLENNPAQSLCLFDGLISHDLTGRLKEVIAGTAVITIDGTAQGIENGALAKLTVSAVVRYDTAAKRIVGVEWRQKDVRDQGPVTPAAELETVTTLKRESLAQPPVELGEAVASAISSTDEPPATLKHLAHRDPKGRYQFLHSRDWHVVGQTDYHLVMRLLDRGDFVAQATVTHWTNAGPGKHMSPEEFEKLAAGGMNWKIEQVTDRTPVATDADRWVFRISARGELDGSPVAQNFYVVAGPNGDQMIVTFTMRPAAASRLGTRDLELVNAIDFPKK
jgi:hypothetical protein